MKLNPQTKDVYVPELCRSGDYLMDDYVLTPESELFRSIHNPKDAMTELLNLFKDIEFDEVNKGLQNEGVITPLNKDILAALNQSADRVNLPKVHSARLNFKLNVDPDMENTEIELSNGTKTTYRHHKRGDGSVTAKRNCMLVVNSVNMRFFTLPRP